VDKHEIHHGGEGRTSHMGGFPREVSHGGKTVTEYAEKFKHLSCFYTLPLDEEWRCRKFENSLHGDIRLMVAPLSIKDFAALVEKA